MVKALRGQAPVLPFHASWIRSTFAPDVQISALSCPRGSRPRRGLPGCWQGSPSARGAHCFFQASSVWRSVHRWSRARILLSFVREALADRGETSTDGWTADNA